MQQFLSRLLAAGLFANSLLCAQTILALDGAQGVVRELSGPPDPAFCLYPDGPIQSEFDYTGSFACPLPGLIGAGSLAGDIAVDRVNDTVWVTDGDRIAEYDRGGVPVRSFEVPAAFGSAPLTGMGINGATGSLWMTDGRQAFELLPPAASCGAPTVVTPPFSLPTLGTTGFGRYTDLEWLPADGTLWACDERGFAGKITTQGQPIITFLVTGSPCGLQTPLTGVTVDTAHSTPGMVLVSDGLRTEILDALGLGGGGTFATPLSCFDMPGATDAPLNGLSFSGRPVTFGAGSGSNPIPKMGSRGNAVTPTQDLLITLAAAAPGGFAFLPFSQSPLCPPLTIGLTHVMLVPQFFRTLNTPVDLQGEAQVQVPIPPGSTIGLEVFYQWFVFGSGPSPDGPPLASSKAGSMRLGFR